MLKEYESGIAPDGQPFQCVTLGTEQGMQITLMDWGATWLSCQLPLKSGNKREVLLGCPSPEEYTRQAAYLGATVGRYANRIAKAALARGGRSWQLSANQDEHQLHGGPGGFHARRWLCVEHTQATVLFRLHSADGDQGFPGNLIAEVRYTVTADNQVAIEYRATVDKDCPVNLTNHAYFHLDGANTDVRQQKLQLYATQYLPVDSEGIPCAPLADVENTGMDFRQPKTISQDFLRDRDQQRMKGYDHAYLLYPACGDGETPAAQLWSADNQVLLKVYTTAPALQLYTGNFLAGTPARQGGDYQNYSGVALESEFLPDSPNHPEWPQPDCWLKPGETYHSSTRYQFVAL
ncbi:galactose-1-epimerase [Acerihabitans arboris]|uniref:Aldose 1-epimerase n=1 Tax=Acerihabitans arboris TaxID=2691583 RepID=A0A845SHJ7_9GAMM|nr:galactose-1-epimerase [Acerihabitans arboris]NDL62777.1 galactose-1-epimerase [Acerihabitans arboris]